MWKASLVGLLRSRPPAAWNTLPAATARRCPSPCWDGSSHGSCFSGFRLIGSRYCSSTAAGGCRDGRAEGRGRMELVSETEAKRLMRLVNVKALKERLGMEEKEVIGYSELLQACQSAGIVKSPEEAAALAHVLDEAGVVWIFGDKVHLHPDLVVHQVRKAVPVALLPEEDPCKHELRKLLEEKEEIEKAAHKQVRRILWIGMCAALVQIGFFFRLTFWEFSWDIMEPVAFFITATGIIVGYAYFLFTSRDPTYQDIYKRLFLLRMRKLVMKRGFDVHRLVELQRKCKFPMEGQKRRVGMRWELDEL